MGREAAEMAEVKVEAATEEATAGAVKEENPGLEARLWVQ